MFKNLAPGCVALSMGDSEKLFSLAKSVGFEGIDPNLSLPLEELQALYAKYELQVGCFGLSVNFRVDEATYQEGLAKFPETIAKAVAVGTDRCCTWIAPCSDDLDFDANLKFHAERLKPLARLLGESGVRLGLEYVGPQTSLKRLRYPFVHDHATMLLLIEAIGEDNVGFMLDSWHWYNSGGTREDLLSLRPEQVVQVHANDAPLGIPVEEQVDNVRELPGATGVIDAATFYGALREIGYDGPVTPEPFKKELGNMEKEEVAKIVGEAMAKIEPFWK